MPVNPYEYDPSLDDDLLDDDERTSSDNEFENADDPYMSVLDEIIRRENLSDDEAAHLRRIVGKMSPSEPAVSMNGFLTFDAHQQRHRTNAAMHRAIIHTLDELTDGRVLRLWRVFELENQLIIAKSTLDASEKVHAANAGTASKSKMNTINFILEVMHHRIDKIEQQYRAALDMIEDYDGDSDLIENGAASDSTPSWVKRVLFWRK